MKRLLTTLWLVCVTFGLAVAQRVITGQVTGDDGDPLIGASVAVKGTGTGARTDVNGNYSVSIPAEVQNATLVFSYTGYATQELALGADNVMNVVLAYGQVLQEAVVTALGITRSEKALGYSVTQIGGNQVAQSGEVNAIQGLAAKSSGIQVVGSSGTPGASSKILIRGNNTLQLNQQPLIVIDNVPYDNTTNTVQGADYPFNANLQGVSESNRAIDINPDDIESVSVLKGPAASSLYGTRAANGVILITTKKGRQGLSASYSISYQTDQVNKLPETQQVYGQGTGGGTPITDANGNVTGSNPAGTAAGGVNSWGPVAGQTFDNFDQFFQNGNTLMNNFSLAGGNETTSFRFSYGNTDQTGIVPNTWLRRNTFRLNATTGNRFVRLTANGAYTATTDSKAQNGSNLSGIMLPLLRMPIDFDVNGGEGEGGYENLDGSQWTYFAAYDNPLWTANRNPNNSNVGRFSGALTLDWFTTDWLTLTARVGTDQYNDARRQIFAIGNNNVDPSGEVWQANTRHEEINTDLLARFNQTFGTISTNVLIGTQLNHRADESDFARGSQLAVDDYYNLNNASILYADNTDYIRRLAGVFLSADVGFNDMLYVTVGGRNDWASTFGPEAKNSFFYPNASLSFILSEIIPENEVLGYAKLRASYAQAGREPDPFQLGTYPSRTYFARPTFTDGFTNGNSFPFLGQNGFVYSTTLGNAGLRPEINTSYEGGFDLKFFQNRLNFNFTYYYSKATDLLVARPIAGTTGFQFYLSNAGSMQNQGIEVDADIDVIRAGDFNWNLGGNFTRNRNEVLALAPGVDQFSVETAFTGIGSYAIAGQPFGAVFGTKWARNDAGQLLIKANGLPVVADEEGFLGNPYPDWTAGIRNRFSFRGLSLYGLLDIRQGGILWNGTWARMNRLGRTAESVARDQAYLVEGVYAPGTMIGGEDVSGQPNQTQVGALQYFGTFRGDAGAYAVENAIQDGSWVRLRELTLSYRIPQFWDFVKGLEVYATGRNLWLDTEYTGVDPETSLTGAGSQIGGFDYFNNPSTKSYLVGLRANF
jgi:TonB-linked SusC/RagA family outer membrane protein